MVIGYLGMTSEVVEGVKGRVWWGLNWVLEKRWRCGSKEKQSEAVAAIELINVITVDVK